jgi:hypothetical protein
MIATILILWAIVAMGAFATIAWTSLLDERASLRWWAIAVAVALAWPLALVVALVLAFLWAIMGDAPDAEDE